MDEKKIARLMEISVMQALRIHQEQDRKRYEKFKAAWSKKKKMGAYKKATRCPQVRMAAAELPLYDEKAACCKCGFEEVHTAFKNGEDYSKYNLARRPHMERRCERCGYRWAERPLDEGHDLELLAREGGEE